jgi:predicted Zn-dependent protease
MRWGSRWTFICFLVVLVAASTWAVPRSRIQGRRPGATAEEQRQGQLAAAQLIRRFGLVRNSPMQARLDAVARGLTRHIPGGDRYRFHILKSNDTNAMTTPDGQVFVTRGLVRVFRSDEDLAAVLAHEISHVLLGHTARLFTEPDEERTILIRRRRGPPVRRTITVPSESRKRWEFEADAASLRLLERAGYPLSGTERVLEYLASEDLEMARRNGGRARMAEIASTHPRSVDRLRALRAILAKRTAAADPGLPARSRGRVGR